MDIPVYNFSQTPDSIAIAIPLQEKHEPQISIDGDNLQVVLQERRLICGKLYASVKPSSIVWQYDPKEAVITIHLDKANEGDWPLLIQSALDGQINGEDMDMQSRFMQGMLLESMDQPEAFQLLLKSAEQGFIPSMLKVGAIYLIGKEQVPSLAVNRDMVKAIEWHEKAAQLGDPEACYILGGMYSQGFETELGPVEPDAAKALAFFHAAVTSPSLKMSDPSIFLAAAFEGGMLALKSGDPQMAAGFWSQSAALGHPNSCYNFAVLLLNGRGVTRNIAGALRLFKAAAAMDPSLQPPEVLTQMSQEELNRLVELDVETRQNMQEGKLSLATLEQLIQKAKNPEAKKTVTNSTSTTSMTSETTVKSDTPKKRRRKEAARRGQENLQTLGLVAGAVILAAFLYNRFSSQ